MLYLTRHMVARRPLPYLGKEHAPGDAFMATDVDADYFVRCGTAADAAPAPTAGQGPAPTPAPTTAPAPAANPSEGLTVAQIKEALAAQDIEIPADVTLKADLAALLDAAA